LTDASSRRLGLALHQQVRAVLRNQIANGEFRLGDRLPTEHALCATFGVSRVTVRLALGELEAEGLIARQPGRGTFLQALPDIDRPHAQRRTVDLKSLLLDLSRRRADQHRRGVARPPAVVALELDLADGAEAAFFTKYYADESGPKCGVKRFFRPAILPFLDDDLIAAPDFDAALAKRVEGPLGTARFWIEAILAEPHMVLLFDIPVGSPMLSIWWTTTVAGEVFAISQMLYPGNDIAVAMQPPLPSTSAPEMPN
jgi:GntR family transcriptional regulator